MDNPTLSKAILLAKALMPRLSREAAISEAARRYSLPARNLASEMARRSAARRKAHRTVAGV